jgi:hypothetical protein
VTLPPTPDPTKSEWLPVTGMLVDYEDPTLCSLSCPHKRDYLGRANGIPISNLHCGRFHQPTPQVHRQGLPRARCAACLRAPAYKLVEVIRTPQEAMEL